MDKDTKSGILKEEIRKWLINLVTSLKTLPKRSDNPPPPRHPSEVID